MPPSTAGKTTLKSDNRMMNHGRFVNLGEECVTENKTVEITVSDRVCDVCQPRIAEQVIIHNLECWNILPIYGIT